jgi:hypothetical protein
MIDITKFLSIYKSFVRIGCYEDEEIDLETYSNGYYKVQTVYDIEFGESVYLKELDGTTILECDHNDVTPIIDFLAKNMRYELLSKKS